MVMKEYGCSLNYLVPNHRACADIEVRKLIYGKLIRDL